MVGQQLTHSPPPVRERTSSFETRDGPLQTDFLVKGSIDGVPVSLLVECDGHTYHDRTPEQAARDRQRDRFLKLTDYEVVRFAASEITSDPEGCALEVFSQMVAVARRAGPRPQPVASGLSAKCGLKASRMAPRPFDPA